MINYLINQIVEIYAMLKQSLNLLNLKSLEKPKETITERVKLMCQKKRNRN